MGKSILIAEQSEIIRKGLVQVIGNTNLFDSINEIHAASNLPAAVKRYDPDILIINPLFITPDLAVWLKEKRNANMRVAAFVYNIFDDDLRELFEDVIQVGDSRNKIKKKLAALLMLPTESIHNGNADILSVREKEIVRLLAQGLNNREISEKLFISPHTVNTHRKNITRKLDIRSVAGLIVYAIINDIVTVEELQQ